MDDPAFPYNPATLLRTVLFFLFPLSPWGLFSSPMKPTRLCRGRYFVNVAVRVEQLLSQLWPSRMITPIPIPFAH